MERNSCLKEHSIGSTRITKDPLKCESQSYGSDDDYLNGFSWPPRSYTCSFCKREFRSAQALGGHMNVHRRDRARMRQSPPPPRDNINGHGHGQYPYPLLNLNLNNTPSTALTFNPNPNPNPKFSSSSSSSSSPSTTLTPFASSLPSSSSSGEVKKWSLVGNLFDSLSPKGTDSTKMKSENSFYGVEEFDGNFKQEDECRILNKAEIVRLDLEIGLVRDSKEDLDLELRLGYSN